MSAIPSNLQAVRRRIDAATTRAQRPTDSVRLIAVSKTFSAEEIRIAARAGQMRFGENYVQEAIDKIEALQDIPGLEWHMIGPIQSNKTKLIAEHFDWVHTIDRIKVAERLSSQRPADKGPLLACIQVNIDDEDTKSGVAEADACALARAVLALPGLRLSGLMAIPRVQTNPSAQRAAFARLRALRERIVAEVPGASECKELSMGMSQDLESAIEEGATLVRVGTAIFGARDVRV